MSASTAVAFSPRWPTALQSDADVGRARALRRSAGDERALRVRSGDPRRAGSSIRGRSGTGGALARGARGHRCPPSFARAWRARSFAELKFLGLLHSIRATEGGYQICVDGPLSLFDSVTKYGQKMAMLLPMLEGCGSWTLSADIRWGKDRSPLTFRASGGGESGRDERAGKAKEPSLPDEIAGLAKAFSGLGTEWKVTESRVVLDLPGTGLCVPDLLFSSRRQKIYFEVLGFWSREAVFRRVDLVRRGLSEKSFLR